MKVSKIYNTTIQTMVCNYSLKYMHKGLFSMKKKVLQGIETKKRLIECARKLFKEKGFNNTTVDDIIKEANSSKGGFYTHFKSKEELLFNMVFLVDENYNAFLEMNIKSKNVIDKIVLYIEYVFNTITNEIGLEFISTIYASQIKDLKTKRFLIATERTYYQVFEKLIEEGKLKNEIKPEINTKQAVGFFTTIFRGVIYDWCLHKGEFNLAEYGGEIMDIMIEQIKLN